MFSDLRVLGMKGEMSEGTHGWLKAQSIHPHSHAHACQCMHAHTCAHTHTHMCTLYKYIYMCTCPHIWTRGLVEGVSEAMIAQGGSLSLLVHLEEHGSFHFPSLPEVHPRWTPCIFQAQQDPSRSRSLSLI